jgi:hypothetical protein
MAAVGWCISPRKPVDGRCGVALIQITIAGADGADAA